MHTLFTYIANGFGSGLSPIMPGTTGSIFGLALLLIAQSAFGLFESSTSILYLSLACFLLGCFVCEYLIRSAAKQGQQLKDPSEWVIDEFAGLFLTIGLVPASGTTLGAYYLVHLIAFRFFDILKPWPIKHFERLPGGWGIMIDDMIAGLMAAAVVWALISYT